MKTISFPIHPAPSTLTVTFKWNRFKLHADSTLGTIAAQFGTYDPEGDDVFFSDWLEIRDGDDTGVRLTIKPSHHEAAWEIAHAFRNFYTPQQLAIEIVETI